MACMYKSDVWMVREVKLRWVSRMTPIIVLFEMAMGDNTKKVRLGKKGWTINEHELTSAGVYLQMVLGNPIG